MENTQIFIIIINYYIYIYILVILGSNKGNNEK